MIVHDAAALFVTVIHRAFLVVQVGAGVAAMLLCASRLLLPTAVRAVSRRVSGPSWRRGPVRARILARRHTRPSQARAGRPLWAHTQPIDYQEAA